MPPNRAAMVVHTVSNGMTSASAMARGSTRRAPRGMPITRMASSSSVTRITPIWAVMAEPERPAIKMAASTGPEFPNQRHAQNVDDEGVGAKLAQLQRHQIGQHHANQKAHQGGDGQGGGANAVEMARHIAPRPFARARAPAAPSPAAVARPAASCRPQVFNRTHTAAPSDRNSCHRRALGSVGGVHRELGHPRPAWLVGVHPSARLSGHWWPQAFHSNCAPVWSRRCKRAQIPVMPIGRCALASARKSGLNAPAHARAQPVDAAVQQPDNTTPGPSACLRARCEGCRPSWRRQGR